MRIGFFSVEDVAQILTDSVDVKQYIKKLKARDKELNNNWGTICTLVEMVAKDGKRLKDVHPYEEPGIDIIPLIDECDLD